jgi:UDP-N-acetylmuramate: L-alanyl-gamma-D-glutamyl-meso-diaminopimelate ligase
MNIHFIAIGGSIMHQLAIALKLKGNTVTGSDDEIFEPARTNLHKAGLLPESLGWFPKNISAQTNAVILGMHARQDNPELLKARELGIKIFSFPEYIYEESIHKIRVAVGGSHGKTTTTAIIMHVLQYANKEFDFMVGAKIRGFNESVKITNAPVIVCEADEYPASTLEMRPKFHFLFPQIAVITGIAWDHINVFPTFEIYVEQFEIFIDTIAPGGLLVYNETDETLQNLINKNIRTDIRYKPYSLPTYFIENGKTDIIIEDQKTSLQIFGNHNLLNVNAAFYVCKELGITTDVFLKAAENFSGASRRLELISANNSTNIYHDFAHAPSKVKASIDAVKQQFPDKKLIAIFELHTYSSLNGNFLTQYEGTMDEADTAIVFYANHALELKRMPPLPTEKIKEGFKKDNLLVFTAKDELEKWVKEHQYKNTSILLMSSGNYDGSDIAGTIHAMSNGH